MRRLLRASDGIAWLPRRVTRRCNPSIRMVTQMNEVRFLLVVASAFGFAACFSDTPVRLSFDGPGPSDAGQDGPEDDPDGAEEDDIADDPPDDE